MKTKAKMESGSAETPKGGAGGTAPETAKGRNERAGLVAELEGALDAKAEPEGSDEEPEGVGTEVIERRGARGERAQRRTETEVEDEEALSEEETETETEQRTERKKRSTTEDTEDTEEEEGEGDPEGVEMPETEAEAEAEAELEEATTEDAEDTEKSEAEAEAERLEKLAEEKGWPRSARKRLSKLLKRVHEAEARAQQLQEAGANTEGTEGTEEEASRTANAERPTTQELRTTLKVEAELEGEIASKEGWLADLDAALATTLNPQSEQYDPEGLKITDEKGNVKAFRLEQVLRAKRQFERDLQRLDNRLEQVKWEHARAAAAYRLAAAREHAFMRDRKSREYQEIQLIGKEYPEVTRIPDWELVLADAYAWRKLRSSKTQVPSSKQAPSSNGKAGLEAGATKKALRAPVRPGATPARVSGRRVETAKQEKRFGETGSFEDGKALVKSLIEG